MKMVRLSAPRTGRFYPPGNIPGTHFCYRLSRPQGHSAAGRIMSMKNCNDTIGNRTRDLLICSAVPQPTAITPVKTRYPCTGGSVGSLKRFGRHRKSRPHRDSIPGQASPYQDAIPTTLSRLLIKKLTKRVINWLVKLTTQFLWS